MLSELAAELHAQFGALAFFHEQLQSRATSKPALRRLPDEASRSSARLGVVIVSLHLDCCAA